MNLAIELEREPPMAVGQWEHFLRQARQAGAADDAPVTEVMCHGSDDIIHSYRVEVPANQAAEPEMASLPVWLVHDLLSVVNEVAKSDGDVRGLERGAQTALQRTYDHLFRPVLGENPYDTPVEGEKDETES